MQEFELWLEFEEVDPENWDTTNNFASIKVKLSDGKCYKLNVWTYNFFRTARIQERNDAQNLRGLYLVPPDLFVKELSRSCIERTIEDLLSKGDLDLLLNPGIVRNEDDFATS